MAYTFLIRAFSKPYVLQVEAFRVKKQTTLAEFKQMLADKWHVPVERQRLWTWATRQNQSVRPASVLAEDLETRVCDIRVCMGNPIKRCPLFLPVVSYFESAAVSSLVRIAF